MNSKERQSERESSIDNEASLNHGKVSTVSSIVDGLQVEVTKMTNRVGNRKGHAESFKITKSH